MKELVLGILLGVEGAIDLKYKEVPLWIFLLGSGVGVGFCIAEERDVVSVLIACVPGIVALLFSKVTKEVIGYGDGILFVMLGTYLSLEKIISIGMLAFSIAGVVALLLLVIFRKNGSYEIPFIPFLCIAYTLEYIIALGEKAL